MKIHIANIDIETSYSAYGSRELAAAVAIDPKYFSGIVPEDVATKALRYHQVLIRAANENSEQMASHEFLANGEFEIRSEPEIDLFDFEKYHITLNIQVSSEHFSVIEEHISQGMSILLIQGDPESEWNIRCVRAGYGFSTIYHKQKRDYFIRQTTLGICLGDSGYLQTFASETFESGILQSLPVAKLLDIAAKYRELFSNLRFFVPQSCHGVSLSEDANLFSIMIEDLPKDGRKESIHAYNWFYVTPNMTEIYRRGEREYISWSTHANNFEAGKWVVNFELDDYLTSCELLKEIYSPSLGAFLFQMGIISETLQFGRTVRSREKILGYPVQGDLVLPKTKKRWIFEFIFIAAAQTLRLLYLFGLTVTAFFLLNTWLDVGVDSSAVIAGMVGLYYWYSSAPHARLQSEAEKSEELYGKMTLLCHETGSEGIITPDGHRWPITESLFSALISEDTGARFKPWVYRVLGASQPWREHD